MSLHFFLQISTLFEEDKFSSFFEANNKCGLSGGRLFQPRVVGALETLLYSEKMIFDNYHIIQETLFAIGLTVEYHNNSVTFHYSDGSLVDEEFYYFLNDLWTDNVNNVSYQCVAIKNGLLYPVRCDGWDTKLDTSNNVLIEEIFNEDFGEPVFTTRYCNCMNSLYCPL